MLSITKLASILQPFAESGEGGPPTPGFALRVAPERVRPGRSYSVVFSGVSTEWLANPPSLSHSGVSGLTVGSPNVIDDVTFAVSLTTGSATGTISWIEATYSIQASQVVALSSPGFLLLPPARPRVRRR